MQRYWFDLFEPGGPERDEEGSQCPDIAYARLRAVRMARDIMASNVMDGRLHLGSFIEIKNAAGEIEERLSFADAIVLTR